MLIVNEPIEKILRYTELYLKEIEQLKARIAKPEKEEIEK